MKIKKIAIGFILASLAASCEKGFDELNIDPKHTTSVTPESVFLAGEKNLADIYTTSIWTTSPFRVISQVWTQTANINEARYSFTTNDAPTGWWNGLYTTVLSNLDNSKSIIQAKDTLSKTDKNKLLVADILEVYAYHLLVNTYGDIPYTEALSRTNAFPKYDSAQTVTNDLLKRLDTDISGLDISAGSYGTADVIYGGDATKWKKFANTLKLKIALLIADKDPQVANAKALEAITSGVFSSSSDDAKFAYYTTTVASSNPIWRDLVNSTYGVYYAPSAFFINTLQGLNDPRLGLLFTKDINGGYSGAAAGLGGTNSSLSKFSQYWLAANAPSYLLDYVETEFLLAEASERGIAVTGTATSHYNAGVTASIVQVGGTTTDATTYMAGANVTYANASKSWREKIGYQKWIAFANRNWDSWTEIRRLGFPNIDVVSPPANAVSTFPQRFYYPSAEQTSNATNWQTAVQHIGGSDVVTAKLFWQQ